MESRHLRYSVVMASEQPFAGAAARLHLDQSALSWSMRELADDLGVWVSA